MRHQQFNREIYITSSLERLYEELRDLSEVKGTGCSFKGTGFNSSTHIAARSCLCVTSPRESYALFWPPPAPDTHGAQTSKQNIHKHYKTHTQDTSLSHINFHVFKKIYNALLVEFSLILAVQSHLNSLH